MLTKTFHYAGLDLILTRAGSWVLVEANDHPIGLIDADELSRLEGENSVFPVGGVDQMARLLCTGAGRQPVCMVLPDCFRLADPRGYVRAVGLREGQLFDDLRIAGTIDEFNALSRAIRALGGDAQITDETRLELREDEVFCIPSGRVGALYRRSSRFPAKRPSCLCVNDLRLRALCANKHSCEEALRHALAPHQLASSLSSQGADLPEVASLSPDDYVITKPVWGSASRGLRRVPLREFSGEGDEPSFAQSDALCQRWIEPSTVRHGGRDYYFDVRIYVIGGEPVAGYARRAAAPRSGLADDSPLAWLTTTGPRLPLVRRGRGSGVELASDQIEELDSICRRATYALDLAASRMDYDRAYACIPNFTTLAGIEGTMRHVHLEGQDGSREII